MRFLRVKYAPLLLVLASNDNVMAEVVPNNLRARTLKVLGTTIDKATRSGYIDDLIADYNDLVIEVDQENDGLLSVTDSSDNVLFGLLCEISTHTYAQHDSNLCKPIRKGSVELRQAVSDLTSILEEASAVEGSTRVVAVDSHGSLSVGPSPIPGPIPGSSGRLREMLKEQWSLAKGRTDEDYVENLNLMKDVIERESFDGKDELMREIAQYMQLVRESEEAITLFTRWKTDPSILAENGVTRLVDKLRSLKGEHLLGRPKLQVHEAFNYMVRWNLNVLKQELETMNMEGIDRERAEVAALLKHIKNKAISQLGNEVKGLLEVKRAELEFEQFFMRPISGEDVSPPSIHDLSLFMKRVGQMRFGKGEWKKRVVDRRDALVQRIGSVIHSASALSGPAGRRRQLLLGNGIHGERSRPAFMDPYSLLRPSRTSGGRPGAIMPTGRRESSNSGLPVEITSAKRYVDLFRLMLLAEQSTLPALITPEIQIAANQMHMKASILARMNAILTEKMAEEGIVDPIDIRSRTDRLLSEINPRIVATIMDQLARPRRRSVGLIRNVGESAMESYDYSSDLFIQNLKRFIGQLSTITIPRPQPPMIGYGTRLPPSNGANARVVVPIQYDSDDDEEGSDDEGGF